MVFVDVGERTREGNDLYREMQYDGKYGVIKLGDKQVHINSFLMVCTLFNQRKVC